MDLYDGEVTGLSSVPIELTPTSSSTGGVTQLAVYGNPGGNTFNVHNTSDFYYSTFLSTGNFDETFTADGSGKQVLSSGVEQVTGPFNPTNNGNGTITETFTFKGLPMKVKIPNGPTLVRDAGNVTEAITSTISIVESPRFCTSM